MFKRIFIMLYLRYIDLFSLFNLFFFLNFFLSFNLLILLFICNFL